MQSVVIHEINEETTTLQQVADRGKVNDQGEGGSLTFPDSSHSVRNRQKKEKGTSSDGNITISSKERQGF
ncbi:hypothetical protein PS2_005904 [Malus domestica]